MSMPEFMEVDQMRNSPPNNQVVANVESFSTELARTQQNPGQTTRLSAQVMHTEHQSNISGASQRYQDIERRLQEGFSLVQSNMDQVGPARTHMMQQ